MGGKGLNADATSGIVSECGHRPAEFSITLTVVGLRRMSAKICLSRTLSATSAFLDLTSRIMFLGHVVDLPNNDERPSQVRWVWGEHSDLHVPIYQVGRR